MKTIVFLDKVVNKISDLGLTAPAIFFLEVHKPLAFVGSQLLLIAQPALDIFLPKNLVRDAADLLSDQDKLEQLITRLETNSASASHAHMKRNDYD